MRMTATTASRDDDRPADRPAGWVHHPNLAVTRPLDQVMPAPTPAGAAPAMLHLVYTGDGLYVPAIVRQPEGYGPFPTIICIHGGSGGLGIAYLVDHVANQGWLLDALIARGFAVVFAEGRCEIEDAYDAHSRGRPHPGILDHNDMVSVFRHVCGQPWADPKRVGFFGVSHGGEMQMKLAAEIGPQAGKTEPMPAALAMCEPAIIEFLGLKYEGARKEANLQFQAPIADTQIDIVRAKQRIDRIPDVLPMLIAGRDEDHLQGPFIKLHELLKRAGKHVEWATFSHPEHAYQFGPRRTSNGYGPDATQQATLAHVLAFLERHVKHRSA
jgi:dienelactone hydrolase